MMPARRVLLLLLAVVAALAAAIGVSVPIGKPPTVAVLVDASPSTRGLWFRDAAAVRRAAASITSNRGATLQFFIFADGEASTMSDTIAEQPAAKTLLPAVSADAVVLFSDGRFDASAVAPTTPIFPVTDSDVSKDAHILGIERDGNRVIATVINDGPPRTLIWADGTSVAVPTGSVRFARDHALAGTAQLNGGDSWPENDQIEFGPAISLASERWWIGESPPPGYRALSPNALPPIDAWLAARVVVLNNVPASALDRTAEESLTRYVSDLSGSLVIVGGSNAFSAGGYGGTALDALSPLVSRPPTPRREWLFLIDASGSMAARTADGRTRLEAAVDAASVAAAAVPAADRIAVATFAREFRAWPALQNRRVAPPADLSPNGPTNLRAALESIVASRGTNAALPLRVALLTDGDAALGDQTSLQASLNAASVTLDWVALDARTDGPLEEIVRASGGRVVSAGSVEQWRASALATVRAAEAISAIDTVPITWRGPFADLGTMTATAVNTTFPRIEADVLAASEDSNQRAIAATWRVGNGGATAIAFAAPQQVVDRIATAFESSPADPRFRVSWQFDRVTVEAIDSGTAMNDLQFSLRDLGTPTEYVALEQRAPAKFESGIVPAARARVMTLEIEGRMIDAHAMASSPAQEFRAIGVDRPALERIANATGGRVIDRDQPFGDLQLARRRLSLAVPLLLTAIAALAAAVLLRTA